jgi:hypothetical protein
MFHQIFEDGIKKPAADHGMVSKWAMNRNYLVSPINGVLKYHRLGNQERNDPEVPFEKASLVLSDVSLTITEVLNVVFFNHFVTILFLPIAFPVQICLLVVKTSNISKLLHIYIYIIFWLMRGKNCFTFVWYL